AAACLAGVFALEDAVRLVAARGRFMQSQPPGQMLAVRASADTVAAMLPEGLSIAAINAPELVVVSGPEPKITDFAGRVESAGLRSSELRTSHAFHSAMMAPVLAPLEAAIAGVQRNAPTLSVHSTALA